VVGVWVGNNDNTPIKTVSSGVSGATPIWRKILLAGLGNKSDEPFVATDKVVSTDVDIVSGYRAHDGFVSKAEFFVKGTEPTGEDSVHKMVAVCKGEGKLAGVSDIAQGNIEKKEFFYFKEEDPFAKDGQNKWQEGILNWLKDQSDGRYHPPVDFCTGAMGQIHISVMKPDYKSAVSEGSDVFIKAEINSLSKIARVEFLVDGVVRDTLTSEPWELTVPRPAFGNHEILIRAFDESGNKGEAKSLFGYGQAWMEPTPSPTITNTPIPPTSTVTPTPVITP
jgi:hypothetical protein